ncbi:hypothetical protein POTOM_061837 [Populus tomentosa]|uniref:Reverse transcriptase domain-containing protein n=1 Tax=Populus tomentosa TaxID=118781 RepID=A0A8X7XNQ1_POPTO|nr:hypothetical protein POTOM_061837 [Populus tomentosa]
MASSYFKDLLTASQPTVPADIHSLYPNTITEESKAAALMPITDDDIKAALFSISDSKAPGPDGYNALFYKKSWDIIKVDFIAAIRYFFSNNFLPRCVNATRVALVPKQEIPTSLNDFRPISCCNVLYKCISKILVIRLKAALSDVVGPSQSAFIPGRNISDAILLTQELMHNYHLQAGPARCALKIDLKKAFDTGNNDASPSHQVKGNASHASNTDAKQLNGDASTSHQGKGKAITSLDTNTDEMSSEESDSSGETDTDCSDETDSDESASDSLDESQLKPSDLGDVNPITPPLSTNNHVRTTPLELPMCTTSKQMALPSSSETSSSSQVPPTYLPKMTPSRARPPESSAAHSVGCDDTGFTLVTRRKKKKDTTHRVAPSFLPSS